MKTLIMYEEQLTVHRFSSITKTKRHFAEVVKPDVHRE